MNKYRRKFSHLDRVLFMGREFIVDLHTYKDITDRLFWATPLSGGTSGYVTIAHQEDLTLIEDEPEGKTPPNKKKPKKIKKNNIHEKRVKFNSVFDETDFKTTTGVCLLCRVKIEGSCIYTHYRSLHIDEVLEYYDNKEYDGNSW